MCQSAKSCRPLRRTDPYGYDTAPLIIIMSTFLICQQSFPSSNIVIISVLTNFTEAKIIRNFWRTGKFDPRQVGGSGEIHCSDGTTAWGTSLQKRSWEQFRYLNIKQTNDFINCRIIKHIACYTMFFERGLLPWKNKLSPNMRDILTPYGPGSILPSSSVSIFGKDIPKCMYNTCHVYKFFLSIVMEHYRPCPQET